MSSKIQLDLFEEESEMSLMRKEVKELFSQVEKFKRSLYLRHRELSRLCLELKQENETLKYRLDQLEKNSDHSKSSENDDLLEKLFKEAYLLQ